MTVSEWYEEYYGKYRVSQSDITNEKYDQKVRKNLITPLGSKRLKDVKPADLQNIMNNLDGKSTDYISKVYEYINDIFAKAVVNNLLNKNPMLGVVKPKGSTNSNRDLTEDERKALTIVAEKDSRYIYFLLSYYCGCRPSEARNVIGGDINDGMLHIRGTKTAGADRYVPIPSIFKIPQVEDDIYVITGTKEPLTQRQNQLLWNKFKKDLETYIVKELKKKTTPGLTRYSFRHAYCCNLLRANVPLKTAMTLMGHTNPSMILNIYQHTDDEMILDASNKINQLFEENEQQNNSKNDQN